MEQQIAVSEKLNPNRIPCEPFGIKTRSTLNRITLTPSKASPNETLYAGIPKLAENIVIVPGSAYLTFDLNVTGHANNTLVNNISRNLIKRQRVLFGEKPFKIHWITFYFKLIMISFSRAKPVTTC